MGPAVKTSAKASVKAPAGNSSSSSSSSSSTGAPVVKASVKAPVVKASVKAPVVKASVKATAAKLRRLKATHRAEHEKDLKTAQTKRIFNPKATITHNGKPTAKKLDPKKKVIYPAPVIQQQYWDKAYLLFDVNVTSCHNYFK